VAVEYYSPDLDHYFITADAGEQAGVERGDVGRWVRTGESFKTGGSEPVCRFYGNTNINPVTGTTFGPNSHFYTANALECAFLQTLWDPNAIAWKFESYAFKVTLPENGNCSGGRIPIYRAYNGGFGRGIDSNHRLVTSHAAYQETIARGWQGEGIVMCAAP
jgi:hypothetical protein